MRKEELLIGTKEEFEEYFKEKDIMKFSELTTIENVIKQSNLNDYYREISKTQSIEDQLKRIENKDPSFGMIFYFKCEHDDLLDKTQIHIKLMSDKIWIRKNDIEGELK